MHGTATVTTEQVHIDWTHPAFDSSAFGYGRVDLVYLRFHSTLSGWQLSHFDVCDPGRIGLFFLFLVIARVLERLGMQIYKR